MLTEYHILRLRSFPNLNFFELLKIMYQMYFSDRKCVWYLSSLIYFYHPNVIVQPIPLFPAQDSPANRHSFKRASCRSEYKNFVLYVMERMNSNLEDCMEFKPESWISENGTINTNSINIYFYLMNFLLSPLFLHEKNSSWCMVVFLLEKCPSRRHG